MSIAQKHTVYTNFVFFLCIYLSCLYVMGQGYDKKGLFLYHKSRIETLEKQKPSINRDTLLVLELDTLIQLFHETDFEWIKNYHHDDTYKKMRHYSYNSKWKKGIAMFHLANGVHLVDGYHSVEGLQELQVALKRFEELKDYQKIIKTLIHTTVVYTYHTDSLSPLPYFNRAVSLAHQIRDTSLIHFVYNYKGDYHVMKRDFKSALYYYDWIDKNVKKAKEKKLNYWTNDLYLATCLIYNNREREGRQLLNKTLEVLPTDIIYHRYLHVVIRNYIVEFYIKKNRFEDAKIYVDQLIKLNNANSHFEHQEGYEIVHKFYYEYHKRNKNFEAALKSHESLVKYISQFHQQDLKNRIDGIKSRIALEENTKKLSQLEIDKLKTESQKEIQLRWFLIAISLLAVISTIYVFLTNKSLKSKNEILQKKNKEISEAMLKGQTIERQRVAADLHDNLGSTLSALWLNVDMIDKSKMNDEEREIHQNLRENLEKAYNDVRLLSHNLLPEEFEKQGLVPTLQSFVRKISKNSKINFDLQIAEGFGRVDNKIEFELYSICLELVNNIIKHSKATEAKIELSRTEKQIGLIVSDNGIGTFNNESDGKGMKNVKARVESLNGVWEIASKENQGTNSQINIPI